MEIFVYLGFALLSAQTLLLDMRVRRSEHLHKAHRDMMEEMINAMEEVDRLHNLDMDRLFKLIKKN